MIAALIAGSVFAADVAVRAQDATNTPPAGAPPGGRGARGQMGFDSIATQLALTDDQKAKAKPVFDEMMQKNRDLRADTSITEPADRRAKMKDIRDAATAKLKDILTPEQFDKWTKMMARGNRRPPGGGAGMTPPAADAKPAADVPK